MKGAKVDQTEAVVSFFFNKIESLSGFLTLSIIFL